MHLQYPSMMKSLLVVTDLDGSLLDHHSYSFDAARPALQLLQGYNIPLILNSSKTAAEIRQLREALGNICPYIVENGAGIYVPDQHGREALVSFGINRADVLAVLARLRREQGFRFTGFADMTTEELMACTGLDAESAVQAKERDFTEPLLWQDSEARYQAFCETVQQEGLQAVRGGRFVHVAAPADKGQAMSWLRDYYERENGRRPLLIALGDGENDVSMLEAADYPVVIKSPVNTAPVVHHANVMYTEPEGPQGWNEAVTSLLNSLAL